MRRATCRATLAVSIVIALAAVPAPAAEDWADPNLKVTDGLQVWLDAARLNAARRAAKLSELADGQAIDAWLDSSGNRRHVVQKDAALQPFYQSNDGYTAVR